MFSGVELKSPLELSTSFGEWGKCWKVRYNDASYTILPLGETLKQEWRFFDAPESEESRRWLKFSSGMIEWGWVENTQKDFCGRWRRIRPVICGRKKEKEGRIRQDFFSWIIKRKKWGKPTVIVFLAGGIFVHWLIEVRQFLFFFWWGNYWIPCLSFFDFFVYSNCKCHQISILGSTPELRIKV